MNRWQLNLAIRTLKAGGVIAYPTESVFGLGCDASNLQAVERVLEIKKRTYHKGLILLVSNIGQAKDFIQPITLEEQKKINAQSKRATTWLIEKESNVSPLLSGLHQKLAIRVTSNPVARELCESFGLPIISTSCNLNGKPTSCHVTKIRNKMSKRVKVIAGACGNQAPSRIIDLKTMVNYR